MRFAAIFLFLAASGRAVDFPHGLHLGMGLECTSCHASAVTSTKAEDNNLPGPDACRTCHGDGNIGEPRKTAVAHFNHSIHVKLRKCTECHRAMDTSVVTGKENFPSMADCTSCHTKSSPPESCYLCHATSMDLKRKNSY